MTSKLIWYLGNSNTNLPRVDLSDIPNFILIRRKRAEIKKKNREVNREIWSIWVFHHCRNTDSTPVQGNKSRVKPLGDIGDRVAFSLVSRRWLFIEPGRGLSLARSVNHVISIFLRNYLGIMGCLTKNMRCFERKWRKYDDIRKCKGETIIFLIS